MKRIIHHIKVLSIAFIGLSLFSCTEDIDFNLNESEEQILVVEGWITNQQMAHTVKLSLSGKFYGKEELPKAEGATVTISDGTNEYVLSENAPGIYQTDSTVKGEFGKTYSLFVDYNGEVYESSSTLDSVPLIDSIKVVPNPFFQTEDTNYFLLLSTTELAGRGNHYMWKIYINGDRSSDTLGNFIFDTDEYTEGQTWVEAPLEGGLFLDKGDTLRLEQISISKESYEIYLAASLETVWRGGIFDAPPSNVPSNISNGALGLWDARGVTEETTVVQ